MNRAIPSLGQLALFGDLDDLQAVDLFAGGGGASRGIELALDRSPFLAVNHDPHAIEMHALNHPGTDHRCESVFDVDPIEACSGKRVDALWASPDCTHHSRAKGGKPVKKDIRGLAWVVTDWAEKVRPRLIFLENVPEFEQWGPLHEDGPRKDRPIKARRGETFRRWVQSIEALGYVVEWRALVACDYGAPTTRKRLYLVARRDGLPIVWPEPTHGPGLIPYRTAAECIDWSIPCPSIFTRKRPLAEKTMARIAAGVKRYVLDADPPYIAPAEAMLSPALVQVGYGERKGQAPRCLNIHAPLGTVVAGGSKHALVAAFLAKHNRGAVGQDVRDPMHTITATDTKAVVAAHLTKFYGTSTGSPADGPVPTVTATGQHLGLVSAFIAKYYGQGVGSGADEPLHTVTTKDRFGLVTVTVQGEKYAIVDIGMRMLQPRELARAQGFEDDYILTGTKTQQVARIGNSVCPPVARALVAAQLGWSA